MGILIAGGWKAHGIKSAEAAGKCDRLSSDLRLWMLVSARVTRAGHASFQEGELRRLLGREGRPMTGSGVREVIGKLKAAGLAYPDSDARCLIVPSHVIQNNFKGAVTCAYCDNRNKRRAVAATQARVGLASRATQAGA